MTIDATANQARAQAVSNATPATKVATPALIALSNPALDVEIMSDLIFENIGGQELINISRNDTLNSQDMIYSLIKNIKDLYIQYNANNIIRLENTTDTYFKNFTIKFEDRLPVDGTGPNGEIVYIDPITGNLIINILDIESDEQVDVQIINNGEMFDDTIY
jgi:hypothetical protein